MRQSFAAIVLAVLCSLSCTKIAESPQSVPVQTINFPAGVTLKMTFRQVKSALIQHGFSIPDYYGSKDTTSIIVKVPHGFSFSSDLPTEVHYCSLTFYHGQLLWFEFEIVPAVPEAETAFSMIRDVAKSIEKMGFKITTNHLGDIEHGKDLMDNTPVVFFGTPCDIQIQSHFTSDSHFQLHVVYANQSVLNQKAQDDAKAKRLQDAASDSVTRNILK